MQQYTLFNYTGLESALFYFALEERERRKIFVSDEIK
ncbi:hypothetical protein IEC_05391 [Bacillus toyonensis]|nr:hypothetical protein IEC_05391 [Bacillus toyonensis]